MSTQGSAPLSRVKNRPLPHSRDVADDDDIALHSGMLATKLYENSQEAEH